MNRYITIEPSRCIACGTCKAACSEGHKRAGLQETPRLALFETREVVASVTCHHCAGAPCLKVCPIDAISSDPDGCVRVDEKRCIGCKLCSIACPFGAIHLGGTPISGVEGICYYTPTFPASTSPILQWEIGVYACAVKCDLCSYDPSGKPHCVTYCVTNALRLVEEDERAEKKAARQFEAARESSILSELLDSTEGK